MKEFSLQVSKEFSNGLRTYHKSRRQQGQFFDLFNVKPTQYGLVPYEPITLPLSADTIVGYGLDDEVFPFPQLFIGKGIVLIACVNRIFYVNPLDWTQLYELTLYDAENTTTEKSITAGGSWEFVDFWDTWFLTNGSCTVFSCGKDTMLGNTHKVYVHDGVPINCATDHLGRVLFGGFTYNDFWDSTWQTFWTEWISKKVSTGLSHTRDVGSDQDVYMPVGDEWIWWSSIGGGDALMLFFPSIFTTTGYTSSSYSSTRPYILDLLKMNTQGFARMPFQGKIQAIRPLGDLLIVYSEEGVAAMKPIVQPEPTYSIRDLKLGGIASRGAVAGNDEHHLYIDKSGMAVHITQALEIQPLGYREFFFPMLGNEITVSFSENPQNNDRFGEFYISGPDQHFGLTAQGLFEHGQVVTGAKYFQGATVGLGGELYNTDDIVGRIGQDVLDFNLPGLKTIESVRLVGRFRRVSGEDRNVTVAIDYRYDESDDEDWSTTSYKGINKEGMVFFPVAGVDFRLRIRITDYEDLDIDYAEFNIKHGDLRYKRSVPINQAFS